MENNNFGKTTCLNTIIFTIWLFSSHAQEE